MLVGKLIHLFTENPVIFLGYSLTDVSVQRLLVDIFSCVESPYDFKRLKERLIYVEYDKKESGVDIGDLIKDVDGRSIHMTKIRLSNYMVLLEHMSEMEKITKLKEVLWLKDLVQNLVVNYQGSKTKIIQMSDDSEDYSGDEVVVAIGKEKDIPDTLQERGLLGLEGDDIFRDIVFNDMPTVSSKESLLKALEKLSHRNSRTLPVHKYLKGFQGEIPPVLQEIQSKGPEDILSRTIKKDRPMFDEFFAQNPEISFEEIYQSSLPNVRKSNFLVLKAALHADAQELREFLERRFHDIPNSSFAPELSL
ncbi:hypothetical protein GCM10025857_39880 [Alicyclobacillus contaminans]|nr:hypothetical protein GCM10025857_00350 [Alicyclobacillus contaminans]GMA52631.1 hypothetical protein GCM10025857_39880 [Alicyclobacillus contaminans]